ncbi:hypothetical protein MBRA_03807 [Methylobacterium brachiatum]|nr:hypothetical protein MBRA_03807 [Methylobacterium brachiatum]
MTQAVKPSDRTRRRTARLAARKLSQTGAPVPRARRAKPSEEPGAFGRPTRATVAARIYLRDWLGDGRLRQADALMMASWLLAGAVQEARAFLDPTSLTMALAAIGTVPAAASGDDLVAKVESILLGVAECEL